MAENHMSATGRRPLPPLQDERPSDRGLEPLLLAPDNSPNSPGAATLKVWPPPPDSSFFNHHHPPPLSVLQPLPHPQHQQQRVAHLYSHPHSHAHHHTHTLPPLSVSLSRSHDPATLSFPDVPPTELPPIKPPGDATGPNESLPSLSSVTGTAPPFSPPPPFSPSRLPLLPPPHPPHSRPPVKTWPSLNPLTTFYTPGHAQAAEPPRRMEQDPNSSVPGGGDARGRNVMSSPRFSDGRATSVSLDDPDVRQAAEGLERLRTDHQNTPPRQEEPLMTLLTTSHPLLARTIEGATSAYNNSKNFSPRFKSGAEYIEGYVAPIVNTASNVSRVTGVERGVRWFYSGPRRSQSSADLEAGDRGSNKRRRVTTASDENHNGAADRITMTDAELYGFSRDRRTSMSTVDSLPVYDDHRSPDYSEDIKMDPTAQGGSRSSAPWQRRLMMTTSGLTIAMRRQSLTSLKYCLGRLGEANKQLATVLEHLKELLETPDNQAASSPASGQQEQGQRQEQGQEHGQEQVGTDVIMTDASTPDASPTPNPKLARIDAYKNEVVKILHQVINTVSEYAGGALPENARIVVRSQVLSLPHRFSLAFGQGQQQQQQNASTPNAVGHENEQAETQAMRTRAQKAVNLTRAGLEMIIQISGVVAGTIHSAEQWLGRMKGEGYQGRERDSRSQSPKGAQQLVPLMSVGVDGDVKMGDDKVGQAENVRMEDVKMG